MGRPDEHHPVDSPECPYPVSQTLHDRAAHYNAAFPQFPDSHLIASDRWLQGTWILGNDYKGSGYYGSYPPGYLKRMQSIFPDVKAVLHLFSGSLPQQATRNAVTVDVRTTDQVKPGIRASALHLPFREGSFDGVYADTPYSLVDAGHYGTSMPNRKQVLREVHRVVRPGGFLIWLDTVLPMYRKEMWCWCGAIALWRSTNHRVRGVSIFERLG